jgi:3-phosphoshikimate 1-carboxyvinyltransferase
MQRLVKRPARLRGTIAVPGDKSVSHRAALFGAIAYGTTIARRFLNASDCRATLSCLWALGVQSTLTEESPGLATLEVRGAGLRGLREPADVLDAWNSGTTLRLLSGILAGQPFLSILTGDPSLRERPVDRVVTPLRQMGATITARDGDRLPPLAVRGGGLHAVRYAMPVASAQVKSAVLLAGLFAEGETVVEEPAPTRDHTERLLSAMGVDVRREGPAVGLSPPERLEPLEIIVPGDISAAAFWLAAAAAHPDAELHIKGAGTNQTRSGVLDALRAMGGDIDIGEERLAGEEPVADITVRSSRLQGTEIAGDLIPRLIDEIPALAVAACFAEGRTTFRDAEELFVKESNRAAALVRELRKLGARVEELPDGLAIEGTGALNGAAVSGGGDHRVTMALAIAGMLANGETVIEDGESVDVSYPAFWDEVHTVART